MKTKRTAMLAAMTLMAPLGTGTLPQRSGYHIGPEERAAKQKIRMQRKQKRQNRKKGRKG